MGSNSIWIISLSKESFFHFTALLRLPTYHPIQHHMAAFCWRVLLSLPPLLKVLQFPFLSLTDLRLIKRELLTRTQSDHHNVITRVLDHEHCASDHKVRTSALIAALPFPSSMSFLFFPRSLSWAPSPSCKAQDALSHIVTV